jgi:hypothetical protein
MEGLPMPVLNAQTPLTLLALLLVPLVAGCCTARRWAWPCAWWARTRPPPKARA